MIRPSSNQPTDSESLLLEQCESIISQGLHELIKVERALDIIKKQRLYEKKFNNFEHYCAEKWSVKKELHYLCCFQQNISNTQ
jgi:hypothetical protein